MNDLLEFGSGRYLLILGSLVAVAKSLMADSSSSLGTLMPLMSTYLIHCFFPHSKSLRNSRVHSVIGGRYI